MKALATALLAVGFAAATAVAQGTQQSCTLNSPLTLIASAGSGDFTHNYTLTLGANGTFTGRSADNTETISGSLVGTTFRLNSTYANGYTYSVTGTLDPATGRITGTGTSSENQSLTFTVNNATTCTTGTASCPAAPAVANAYLRTLDESKRRNGRNIISMVAREQKADGAFRGLKPCDAGFAAAVRAFVDSKITP